jgi:hypothetical protein
LAGALAAGLAAGLAGAWAQAGLAKLHAAKASAQAKLNVEVVLK